MLNLVAFKATNLTFFVIFMQKKKLNLKLKNGNVLNFCFFLDHYKCRWQLIEQTDVQNDSLECFFLFSFTVHMLYEFGFGRRSYLFHSASVF